MRVRAPGKVVLSGAYAVLEGAPALVAAVDRYVVADATRPAERQTQEVAAAIELGYLTAAPWFDASALRTPSSASAGGSRKLGLGSSAAIVVASLGAALLEAGVPEAQLARAVLPAALEAHRRGQGGGSGVDVAASCHGGVLRCRRAPVTGILDAEPIELPAGLTLEIYAASASATTSTLLARVRRLAAAAPERYRAIMAEASRGAEQAAASRDTASWLAALRRQGAALARLGAAAGASIVTGPVADLAARAEARGGHFGPAGAGGGDVAFYAGAGPSSDDFRAHLIAAGLRPLSLQIGARGLHAEVP